MSAKWRRNKKSTGKFNIFKVFNHTKKVTSNSARTKTRRVKSFASPYRHRVQRFSGEKKLREPEPLVDVVEESDDVTIVAEFAGFDRKDLKIQVKNQRVTLSAETRTRRYHKSLNLPKRVIPSTLRTACKNGVLEIRLRKAAEEKTIDKVAG